MRRIRNSIVGLLAVLFLGPLVDAQDLSKYRNFSFGMKLPAVLRHTDQSVADVKIIHRRPARIEELTWWPPASPGKSHQADAVQQVLFSFYNGELYKVFVTYDPGAVEGLTAEDMIKSISVRYGPPSKPATEAVRPANEQALQVVAAWDDPQYSLRLVPSFFSSGFSLILFSKQMNAEAEAAVTGAGKLEEEERPQKEADLEKSKADRLEVARQKNKKIFLP